MGFDDMEAIKDDRIQEIVKASENPKETIRQLSEQQSRKMKQLEEEYWERARFCECGADSLMECSCDKDKQRRYMKRTSRKINKELGMTGATLAMLRQEYNI